MNSGKLFAQAVKNWPAKVLSIVLALILVIFHQMSTLEDRFFSIPLQIEGDTVLTPSSSYARMIRVSLRGDPNSIYPIQEEDIEAYLDLSRYTEPGTYRIPVQVRKKGTALGVEPLEISLDPLELSLELDLKISKSVSLRPNFRGSVESGYELSSYTLTPSQVSIDGPQSLVNTISEFTTEVIDLEKRQDDFSLTTAVLNRDPLITIRGRGTVEFRGAVREQMISRDFENIPISPLNLDGRLSAALEPELGTVRLRGGRRGLGGYVPPEDLLSLDCSGIQEPGTYTLPVTVNISPSLNLSSWEPEQVEVHVGYHLPSEEL